MKKDRYWQEKVSVWLHDPVCKVFDIQNHEEIAAKIAELLIQPAPVKEQYQVADRIASSMARTSVLGYDTDPKKNGSITFTEHPVITHPLVKDKKLQMNLPSIQIDTLVEEIKKLLTEDLGLDKTDEELRALPQDEKPLNGMYKKNTEPEQWAQGLFNYLFFALPRRLRTKNIGNLGALWDLLPADTRIPDHPLWHHLGLVSAINSSLANDPNQEMSMVVFSISPVQDFIANARKLRDYWTGSVLLSYLAFSGISAVIEELGPDHIVYPSLHNQSLVDVWLNEKFGLKRFLEENDSELKELNKKASSIAAFPNKFVFLCAQDEVKNLCSIIQNRIQEEWVKVSASVQQYLRNITKSGTTHDDLWENQINNYWTCSWAATRVAKPDDIESVKKLLDSTKYEYEYKKISEFSKHSNDNNGKPARLYGTTHSLVQGVLAAGKMKPVKVKTVQSGEKCPLCGEHEVLHDFKNLGKTSAKEYSDAVKQFWDKIREKTNSPEEYAQTGKTERLCAVCAVKRYLPIVIREKMYEGVLCSAFKDIQFPSTTEIAMTTYLNKLSQIKETQPSREKIIHYLHSSELLSNDDSLDVGIKKFIDNAAAKKIKISDRDKYYVLLMMDGDKMGDLINGDSIEAQWSDVLHPELVRRYNEVPDFAKTSIFADNKIFNQKRIINPALHAMISDSLNNFARYGVQPVVEKSGGKLIYAGGDDVCAILPLDTAMQTAVEIQKSYTMAFAQYTENGVKSISSADATMKKIGLHLGSGAEKISISAAIIIAHHKTPLREVIRDAHFVLDTIAKNKGGRNAVAIRLKKRSGGDRDFYCKWDKQNIFCDNDETVLDSFKKVCAAVATNDISSSFLYKIGSMKSFFEPLLNNVQQNKEKILKLFSYELKHSGFAHTQSTEKKDDLVRALAGICIQQDGELNVEAPIIASFIGNTENLEGNNE